MSLENSENGWNGIQKEILSKAGLDDIPSATFAYQKEDPVNKPPHYRTGDIECIDYLCDNLSKEGFRGYLEGNAKKYMHRWRHKGGTEDLEKAQWYLTRLIKESNIGSN